MIFDTLENLETYAGTVPQLRTVAQAMDHDSVYDLPCGHYTTPDQDVSYDVIEYTTNTSGGHFEYHKHHTYVEIVLSGQELMSTTWRELKDSEGRYNARTDTGFFTSEPLCAVQAAQGRFALFLPGEPFCTGVSAGDIRTVRKAVFTIKE